MTTDPNVADYGESDIEAKAMTRASSKFKSASPIVTPAATPTVPVAGTTETDLEKNLREKQRRESNS